MSSEDKHYHLDDEPLPEGEEAPPPLTHTMAIIRWCLLIGLSLFAVFMIANYLGFAPWEARGENITQYHCPMHPTYISNQPGECPICGMSLVPINSDGKNAAKTDTSQIKSMPAIPPAKKISEKAQYYCPMDTEVVSDKPGRCPKCGMDLVLKEISSDSSAIKSESEKSPSDSAAVIQAKYTCPMHPEVISDKPGRCPKCGMNLVKMANEDKKIQKPGDSKAKKTTIKKESPKKAQYICPMDTDVVSDKPGRCPKCGMDLVLKTAKDESMIMPDDPPQNASTSNTDQGMENMPGMGETTTTSAVPESSSVPGLMPVTIEPQRLQLIGLRTGFAELKNPGGKVHIVGFVTPNETKMKNIQTRVSGWVLNLAVDKTGQYIEANQPLMTLYSQDLYQAEQDFMVARDAAKTGVGDSALAKMRLQLVDASRERLRLMGLSNNEISEIEKSDLPSAQMIIRSPFSGYVLEKAVLPGQFISPDQSLFTIADLNNVWVIGDVYEQDLPYIHTGQTASMKLTSYPGENYEGTISYIYPSVSEQTRTIKVRIEFHNPSLHLRPGMYAEVEVDRGGNKALVVPAEAVIDGGEVQYVFVVRNGKHFEPRKVTIGRSSDDWMEILSGLSSGEEVVTSANFLIDSESRLNAAITGMGAAPSMPDMPDMQKTTSENGNR